VIYLILLAVLAIAVVLFYLTLPTRNNSGSNDADTGVHSRPHSGSGSTSAPAANRLSIEDVDVGGVLRLKDIKPEFGHVQASVKAKHLYREGTLSWTELELETDLGTLWLEIEKESGQLCLSLTLKSLTLTDLEVTEQRLEGIDDREEGALCYEGKIYQYEDSGTATFLENGSNPEEFYYWEFESEDEESLIGVECWEDQYYEASYGEYLDRSQVEVCSLKG